MNAKLDQIAVIRAGHPFRGAIKEVIDGNGYVIQTRDLNENGQIGWHKLTRTEVVGRKEPEWLMAGDVVFAARGARNLASVVTRCDVDDLAFPVICSPHYFQIRINNDVKILPEFLAWQLNQAIAQRYFQQSAEGSAQVSIRRTLLGQVLITLPPLKTQQRVFRLSQQAMREEKIYQRLIELRRTEMNAVADQILTEQVK